MASSINAAIAAIRADGATQEILVPAASWSSAANFTSDGGSAILASSIRDADDNYAIEVHQYLDADASGTRTAIASNDVNTGVERLTAITQWDQQTGTKLFLGETGVGTDPTSTAALNNMLSYMQQNAGVWQGVTYFAGGPWWGNQGNSIIIEPTGLGTGSVTDRPQMAVLAQYAPGVSQSLSGSSGSSSTSSASTTGSGGSSATTSASSDMLELRVSRGRLERGRPVHCRRRRRTGRRH